MKAQIINKPEHEYFPDREVITPLEYLRYSIRFDSSMSDTEIIAPVLGKPGFGKLYVNGNYPKYFSKLINIKEQQ